MDVVKILKNKKAKIVERKMQNHIKRSKALSKLKGE
jgi:hypothetical protein